MIARRVVMFTASAALAALLILVLVRLARIDIAAAVSEVRTAKGTAIVKLVLLNAILIMLSTEKWRSVDSALRASSDPVPTRTVSFALTSLGMALGFLLPVQFGMAAARTLGTHFYGNAFRRGMAGSIFEQSFDVLTVCVLAFASALTLTFRAGAETWICAAIVMMIVVYALAGCVMRVSRDVAAFAGRKLPASWGVSAGLKRLSELEDAGVLSARLARRLIILSGMRFGVVVLMAGETAAAVSAQIPLWHLAAAIPFVVLATAIAVTPGGVGVNELTYSGALSVFGTSFSAAANWTIANRVLGMTASFLVAFIAAAIFAIGSLRGTGNRGLQTSPRLAKGKNSGTQA